MLIASIGALLLLAPVAQADDFPVTRTDDPLPGACLPADCSLREAATAADGHAGTDRVVLQGGLTYTLTGGLGDISFSNPGLTIVEPASGGRATIDAGGAPRVFDEFFGGPPRKPETWMNEREFDIAASVQKVCEEVVLRMARYIHKETGLTNLCMAGGVALNCVANGRIIRETPFKSLFVQPAAGDAGGAVGVAHWLANTIDKQPRGKAWTNAYLGPAFSDEEIAYRVFRGKAREGVYDH